MLKHLTIENIAIIEHLTVSFESGFTVITGETGAGKSVLLESIGLVFGAKANAKELIRHGTLKAKIELIFHLSGTPNEAQIRASLLEQGVELDPEDPELILSREMSATVTRFRVNGLLVPREVLQQLKGWLLDCQGQHEVVALFQQRFQQAVLDAFGDADFQGNKLALKTVYQHWQEARRALEQQATTQADLLRKQEFLRYQLDELEQAGLSDPQEDELCAQKLARLSYAEKLKHSVAATAYLLSGDVLNSQASDTGGDWERASDAQQLVGKAQKAFQEALRHDDSLTSFAGQLNGILVEIQALSSGLADYFEDIETDPETLKRLLDRKELLEKLKRKYAPTLAEVISLQVSLMTELDALENSEANMQALTEQVEAFSAQYTALAETLSQARQALIQPFKERLLSELRYLALPNVAFDVVLETSEPSAEGRDRVVFLFSANPGEPLRPLSKVASGGELSRVLLALKTIAIQWGGLATMIFDEIDTGISGTTAKAVAEKLVALSKQAQVLAITHQPIVAAMAHKHYHLEKQVESGLTRVSLTPLEQKEKRLLVLSRLASGIDTDDETLEKFASRLLEEAQASLDAEPPKASHI